MSKLSEYRKFFFFECNEQIKKYNTKHIGHWLNQVLDTMHTYTYTYMELRNFEKLTQLRKYF